jgi:hypothetical protein
MRNAFVRSLVPVAALATLAGGALVLVRAFRGKGLVARVRERLAQRRAATREPQFPARLAGAPQAPQVPPVPPSDPVDEASWESFPASDPPATGRFETRR